VLSAKGREALNNVSLDIAHSEMLAGGETLLFDGLAAGTINSPCYSHRLGKSLALAHVIPGFAVGTRLKVTANGMDTTATIVERLVYDRKKMRTHAA